MTFLVGESAFRLMETSKFWQDCDSFYNNPFHLCDENLFWMATQKNLFLVFLRPVETHFPVKI